MNTKKLYIWFVVLLASVLLGGCGGAATVEESPAAPTDTPIPPTATRSRSEVPRISGEELNERLDNGEAILVVDNRAQSDFERSHIAGAILMPSSQVEERLDELPRDQEIVLYCN